MNHRRIDKIEGLLSPTQSIILWLEEINEFDTFKEYQSFCAEFGRPSPRVHEEPVTKHAAQRKASPESVRHWRSELCFKQQLVVHLNDKLETLYARAELGSSGVSGILWAVSQDFLYQYRINAILLPLAAAGIDSSIAAAIVAATIRHVTGPNDFAAYLKRCVSLDSRVTDKQHGYDQLNPEVQKLCERNGLNGFSVDLGPTSIEVLRNAPLIDGHWIDQLAIELAEFAQVLHTRGMTAGLREASHFPTASASRRRNGRGRESNDSKIAASCSEVTARLSRFPGRTKQIGEQPYWSIDDYRAWPERMIGGDLPVEQGVITWRWNNWLMSLSVSGQPEVAGILLQVLDKDEDDNDSLGRDNLIALHPMIMILNKRLGISGALARAEHLISRLLIEPRAIEIASERLGGRHLQGHQILIKPLSKQLKTLIENAHSLADNYNQLAATYNKIFEAVKNFALGSETLECGFKKIDFSEIEKLAQQEASDVVSDVVALAKLNMYSSVGDRYGESEVLAGVLEKMSSSETSPDVKVT